VGGYTTGTGKKSEEEEEAGAAAAMRALTQAASEVGHDGNFTSPFTPKTPGILARAAF